MEGTTVARKESNSGGAMVTKPAHTSRSKTADTGTSDLSADRATKYPRGANGVDGMAQ
jgi:hypothetical protein